MGIIILNWDNQFKENVKSSQDCLLGGINRKTTRPEMDPFPLMTSAEDHILLDGISRKTTPRTELDPLFFDDLSGGSDFAGRYFPEDHPKTYR